MVVFHLVALVVDAQGGAGVSRGAGRFGEGEERVGDVRVVDQRRQGVAPPRQAVVRALQGRLVLPHAQGQPHL